MPRILIADDDQEMRNSLTRILKSKGYAEFSQAVDSDETIQHLKNQEFDLLLLDYTMPGLGGMGCLEWCREHKTEIPIVMITGRLETSIMIDCLKKGAYDYITKPFEILRLTTTVEKALLHRSQQKDITALQTTLYKEGPNNTKAFKHILTECPTMKKMFAYAESSATSNRDILITGETGTGKDLMAQSIHTLSGRVGEYVAVNAAGLDDQLFADTLFGHLEGAFTGANNKRTGLIELAKNGTLFLDEIGDLTIASQVKLLRVLQEREYLPLGADRPIYTSTRVIAATSVDLEKKMEEGEFRKDLFFRLRAHHLHIPPLRSRRSDITLLFNHFLKKCLKECNKTLSQFPDPQVYAIIEAYPFSGNVRELEAFVYDLIYRLESDFITLLDLKQCLDLTKANSGEGMNATIKPAPMQKDEGTVSRPSNLDQITNSRSLIFPDPLPTIEGCTDQLITEAMHRFKNNKTKASEALGMSRKGLINRWAKITEHTSKTEEPDPH